ncbi:MAG: glycosyl hydrolase family 38 [Paraprevotella sp.]|nr:glycoside hydrolase family 38 C-terminal domain-containing protein [Paraprevotella sp.]MBS4807212.1 glycosyl hydrolase family 38 [Paraprevotella sp.]
MRLQNLFLGMFLWGAAIHPVCSAASPVLQTKLHPAVYKSSSGPVRRVAVTVGYDGQVTEAELALGRQVRHVRLEEGENHFVFDIPDAGTDRTLPLSLRAGQVSWASDEVKVPVARHWQMNLVQHTHTDIGYTRSQMEILAEHLRYIDYALDYCDATDHYPDAARFRWTCEVAWPVKEYLKNRPASQVERLKRRVKEGRIELGAMYLNFDELPDEQTLAASLAPLKLFRDEGIRADLAVQDDVNGIAWCFSEYFADAGVKYLNMGTHGHRALICFDKPTVFWWESPSGKKILAYRAEHYHLGNYWGVHNPDDFTKFEQCVWDYLGQLEAKGYPYDICAIQHSGYLTDNAPPSTRSCEMVKRWNEKYEWPKLRTAVATDFIKTVERDYAAQIPVIRGAWPDWWTDGFASGAREAAVSRATHSHAIAGQGGLALAKLAGAELPQGVMGKVSDMNEALLFYDEHTFGYCESVRDPYGRETWEQRSLKQSYAWEAYRHAGLLGETVMGLLQSFVPKTDVPSVAVFNTLNWSYSGIAKVYIDHQLLPRDKVFEITDASGRCVPAQAGESRSDGTYWYIYVRDVPALGFARYRIDVKDEPRPSGASAGSLSGTHVENEWYGLDFNLQRGTISRLYDKDLQRQLLTESAEWELGEFIYETIDDRGALERYTYPRFTRRHPEKMRFETYEEGAIWDTYRFKGETAAGIGHDNLTVEYHIYKVEKKIEVVYSLRKKTETEPEAVYVSFPYQIEDGRIFLDVPGGNIEAGVDQIPGSSNDWYTVQNFAAARSSDVQVVMGSLEIPLMQFGAINTGRYQAGAVPQTTNMYSWPMNNYWTTNFNADQTGGLQWSYFITSSADTTAGFATRFAWENRIPFLTRVLQAGDREDKDAPSCGTFLTLRPDNLLLVNMAPVEGERAVMLHLRETDGRPAAFAVTSDKVKIRKVTVCDVTGKPVGGKDEAEFNPWESKFIKLSW